jgi:outer membrane protein assembly factor BamB
MTPEGIRLLSVAFGKTLVLLPFGPDGQPVWNEETPFTEDFPEPLGDVERTVVGEVSLWNLTGKHATFDNVTVTQGEQVRFADNFATGNTKRWEGASNATVTNGRVGIMEGGFLVHQEEQVWREVRLEADVTVQEGEAGVIIGNQDRYSSFFLTLNAFKQSVFLRWRFQPPPELNIRPQVKAPAEKPLKVLDGVPYRLRLDVVDGQVRASVKVHQPAFDIRRDERANWSGVVVLAGGVVLLTEDGRLYSLTPEGTAYTPNFSLQNLDAPVSEARVWEGKVGGVSGQVLGLCFPHVNTVLVSMVAVEGRFAWPFLRTVGVTTIGAGVGRNPGQFLYPLSLYGGPDGRLFILDTGNARSRSSTPRGST